VGEGGLIGEASRRRPGEEEILVLRWCKRLSGKHGDSYGFDGVRGREELAVSDGIKGVKEKERR
jgi:hypothetical protein